MASEPRWRWIATRKRPRPGTLSPELGLAGGGQVVLAGGVEDARGQPLHDPGHGGIEGRRAQLPVDPHVGHGARLQVQIRPPDLVQVRQKLFQLGHLAYIGSQARELQPSSASSVRTSAAAATASRPGPPLVGGSGTRRSPTMAATHAAADVARASRS